MNGDIHLRFDRGRLAIEIRRPQKANSLTPGLTEQLRSRIEYGVQHNEVRVVTVRGEGDRHFCGGLDVGHLTEAHTSGVSDLMETIRSIPVPTIALVNGHAIGAGLELVCSCDLRLGVSGVLVGMPAVRLAVPYRLEGLSTILEVFPQAASLFLTGENVRMDSVRGLADAVVSHADLEATASRWCEAIVHGRRDIVAYTLNAIRDHRRNSPSPATVEQYSEARQKLLGQEDN